MYVYTLKGPTVIGFKCCGVPANCLVYCTVLYCIVPYCTVLYCAVLYCVQLSMLSVSLFVAKINK